MLEMTFSMIGALLLLYGTLAIFVWVNKNVMLRHERYEIEDGEGRVDAGKTTAEVKVKEEEFSTLDIFSGD